MSQSLLYHASGVRAGYRYRRTEYVEGRVEFHLAVKLEKVRCPHCGSDSYTHYTRVLARYVCDLSRVMSLRDVSRLTQLGWDTVKAIVKNGPAQALRTGAAA